MGPLPLPEEHVGGWPVAAVVAFQSCTERRDAGLAARRCHLLGPAGPSLLPTLLTSLVPPALLVRPRAVGEGCRACSPAEPGPYKSHRRSDPIYGYHRGWAERELDEGGQKYPLVR